MYAVTEIFTLKTGQGGAFLPLMQKTAATPSLREEPGCHRFDVGTGPARPDEVFLYELYSDAAAFQAHLGAVHSSTFDVATAEMSADKRLALFEEVWP